ncbi:MAG: bifunctional folylpolyglutamate synthase/dihydrofolate synthase [Thermosulfidibacteraceae bacterium]
MEGKFLTGNIDSSVNLSLDRVIRACEKLSIDRIAEKTIIVGGTNGKGSTILYLESLLLRAGYRLFTYLSPHLLSVSDRIRVNGVNLEEIEISRNYEEVRKKLNSIWDSLTPFERFTVTSFYIAKQGKFDFALLEVGMGGRLDATNVFNNEYAVITSIALDHMDFLGDTIEEIAWEKAGIIKEGTFVVLGDIESSAYGVIEGVARGKKAILKRVSRDFGYDIRNFSIEAIEFSYSGIYLKESLFKLRQLNPVFAHNASLSIYLAENIVGSKIGNIDVYGALLNTEIPGRFEVVRLSDSIIILDVAHNFDALKVVKDCVDRLSGDVVWFISPVRGKNWWKVIDLIDPGRLFLVENPVRGFKKEELQRFGKVVDLDELETFIKNEGTYVFTGSFYIVGEVKRRLEKWKRSLKL